MLDFQFNDEQRMLRDLAHQFAEKEINPVAEHYDTSGEYPWPVIRKGLQLGLMNVNIPEEYGGPGLDVLGECIVNEELAWGCSGIQTAMMLNSLACWPIILGGNEALKQKYLGDWLMDNGKMAAYGVTEPGAGSDVAGIKTTAVRKNGAYILNGSKTWITNAPIADFFVIFAKTDLGAPTAACRSSSSRRTGPASAPANRSTRWASTPPGPARCSCRMWKCRPRTGWARKARAS